MVLATKETGSLLAICYAMPQVDLDLERARTQVLNELDQTTDEGKVQETKENKNWHREVFEAFLHSVFAIGGRAAFQSPAKKH